MKKKIHGIIVGDEILSGKRQDKHLHYLAKTLNSKGLSLNKVDYVSDDLRDISETIQKKLNCIVFCFGGIGATPDDCTRQAAAKAHQRKLAQHPEALQLIIDQFGVDADAGGADFNKDQIFIRNAGITQGSDTFNTSEWTVVASADYVYATIGSHSASE